MTDYNPITTPNTVLTDALNATYITYNGNEMMIQNDMGNTLIQDTTTGNIMSLSSGFIPVGMKEHGGILYIASYNPETKEGEIGTIPSPLFNYTYDETPRVQNLTVNNSILSLTLPKDATISLSALESNSKIQICDYAFNVGEQFIIKLGLTQQKLKRTILLKSGTDIVSQTKTFDLLGSFNGSNNGAVKKYGLYDLKLYAGIKESNLGLFPLDSVTNSVQTYYTLDDPLKLQYANNWFLTNQKIDVDLCQSLLNSSNETSRNVYRTYPNIPHGNLFIQVELVKNEECVFVKNESTQLNSPYYGAYTITTDEQNN